MTRRPVRWVHRVVIGAAATLAACSGGSSPSDDAVGSDAIPASTIPPPVIGLAGSQPPATLPPPPTAATAPPTTLVDEVALTCVNDLPLRMRVGQIVWPATYAETFESDARRFADWGVGGAIVMTWKETSTIDQLKALKTTGEVPLVLSTDEEGGDVQRFSLLGALPAAGDVDGQYRPEEIRRLVADHGVFMKAAGIDIVFGPVVDVGPLTAGDGDSGDGDGGDGDSVASSDPMGNRVFGNEPVLVDAYALAYIAGWQDAGILPIVKHFPGHGSASGDTHNGVAKTPILSKLRQRDLLPYTDIVGTGAGVMVGHLDVPDLTDQEEVPASLSTAAITGLLREELGFTDALVVTDALGMKAITDRFPLPEAAEMAISAGADVALFTNTDDTPQVIDRLIEAVDADRLEESRLNEAVLRVLKSKSVDPCTIGPADG